MSSQWRSILLIVESNIRSGTNQISIYELLRGDYKVNMYNHFCNLIFVQMILVKLPIESLVNYEYELNLIVLLTKFTSII